MGPTSKSSTSNLGSRDTCSLAHCSILADFLISSPCQRQGSLSFCCLMKGQHSQLWKNSLQGTEKEEKSSCLQLKGRAERSQIICLLFLLQHDPDTLSLLPAVHSCGLPPSTTTWSQSEQEADLAENYSRKKKLHKWLKKRKIKTRISFLTGVQVLVLSLRGVGLHSWRSRLGWDENIKIFLRGSLALNQLKLI